MLTSHNKIQKHKAHIEKRISELENKLREPIHENEASSKKIDNQELPYRRIYAQQQIYVEPQEVTALRERQINARQSRNRRSQPLSISDPQIFRQDNYLKTSQHVQNDRRLDKQLESRGSTYLPNSQQIYYPKKQQRQSILRQRQPSQQNNDLYALMGQILNNQKNLEKEIGLLRSEWLRQQTIRKEEKLGETISQKNRYNDSRVNQVISFQEPESVDKPQIVQIAQRKPEQRPLQKESQRRQVQINEKPKNVGKKNQSYEQETFGVNSPYYQERIQQNNESPSYPVKQNRQSTMQKNRKSSKKVQEDQIQQKLSNLVKNQKGRNQRLIVTQGCKNQFWKRVEDRILTSENEYKESRHRNIRHEHDHLINTNELQKKLKDDLISKIYSQCNNCLYK